MKNFNNKFMEKGESQILISDTNKINPLIFAICSVIGICMGTVCETINSGVYTTIRRIYDDYLVSVSNYSFLGMTLNCIAYNSIFIICALVLGLCAVGKPLLYFIPFVKGLGIGCVCSYIYSAYALKGVLYCTVLIFPASLVELIAVILACSESHLMSTDILKVTDKKETEQTEIDINFYLLRYCVIFVLVIISSLLYALMCKLFLSIIG